MRTEFAQFMDKKTWQARHFKGAFVGETPGKEEFLSEKARHRKGLERDLRFPKGHEDAVAPTLKSCLLKLNKLRFAYTTDSNRALFAAINKPNAYDKMPPRGKKRFIYRSPFINIHLDGSEVSLRFWHRLAELAHKYPDAFISPHFPATSFEIIPFVGEHDPEGIIKAQNVKAKLAEARRFFRDVEKIVDEFSQTK